MIGARQIETHPLAFLIGLLACCLLRDQQLPTID